MEHWRDLTHSWTGMVLGEKSPKRFGTKLGPGGTGELHVPRELDMKVHIRLELVAMDASVERA